MEKGLLKVSIQGITVSLLIKVPPALGRGQFQIIVLLGPSACRSSPFTNLKIEIMRSVMNCKSRGRIVRAGVVLQFCVKKQRNKALLSKNKSLFSRNKALLRIKICVNFIFIFQDLLLNHFYCMLLSSWVLVFPLTICFYNLKIKYFKVFLPKNS